MWGEHRKERLLAKSQLAVLEKQTNEMKETKQTIEQKLKAAEILINANKLDEANQSLLVTLELISKHPSYASYANQTKVLLGKVEEEKAKIIAAANEEKNKEEEQKKQEEEKKKQEEQKKTSQQQQQNPMNPDEAIVYIANQVGIPLHANIFGNYQYTNEKSEYVIQYNLDDPSVANSTYCINPYTKVYYKIS